MNKHTVFAVVGGDLRNAHLANSLAEKKPDCKVYGLFFDGDVKLSHKLHTSTDIRLVLPQSDVVILPVPALDADGNINTPFSESTISWRQCFDYLQPGAIVLAGKVPEAMCLEAAERGIELIDYLEREEFAVLNAVPSALSKRR